MFWTLLQGSSARYKGTENPLAFLVAFEKASGSELTTGAS